jgi:hypothetical protein
MGNLICHKIDFKKIKEKICFNPIKIFQNNNYSLLKENTEDNLLESDNDIEYYSTPHTNLFIR